MGKIKVFQSIRIFIMFIFIGFCFNVLAFILPYSPIHDNVRSSVSSFQSEGAFPQLIFDYRASTPDNNTDEWMLLIADYNGSESIIEKALCGFYNIYTENDNGLIGQANIVKMNDSDPIGRGVYSRYWHGWLLPLRLFLMLFDYSGIRTINMFIQFISTIGVFLLLQKKNLLSFSIPLGGVMLLLFPITLSVSLMFSITYYVILFAISCILIFDKYIDVKLKYNNFFMVIGMITAYFEFLGYPILTLGIPLGLYLFLLRKKK